MSCNKTPASTRLSSVSPNQSFMSMCSWSMTGICCEARRHINVMPGRQQAYYSDPVFVALPSIYPCLSVCICGLLPLLSSAFICG